MDKASFICVGWVGKIKDTINLKVIARIFIFILAMSNDILSNKNDKEWSIQVHSEINRFILIKKSDNVLAFFFIAAKLLTLLTL